MSLQIKNRTLLCLSLVSLLLAGASLVLHSRAAYIPFAKRILAMLSLSETWVISWMGLVVAAVQLAVASRFYGTTLFQTALMMAVGWGMLLKTDSVGLYHLAVSAGLAVFALYSLYANIYGTADRPNRPTKSGIPGKSSSRILNPAKGLDFSCPRAESKPSKSPHRHSTNCVVRTLRQDFIPPLDCRGGALGQCLKEPSDKVQELRRDSSSEMSKMFTTDPSARASGRYNLVSVPEEVVVQQKEPIPEVPRGQSTFRRISGNFQEAITYPFHLVQSASVNGGETTKPLGWLDRIACLLAGMFLGTIVLVVVAGLVVALDHLYPMPLLTDFARIFRRNYATVLDMLGAD